MGEVLELIEQAKYINHDIYKHNMGQQVVVYESKKVLI